MKAAIRWTRANAAKLGVDADKIVIAGYSAGGMLSLLAAGTNGKAEFEGTGGTPGVSSTSTPASACTRSPAPKPRGGCSRKARPLRRPSPLRRRRATSARSFAPTIFVHGTGDKTMPLASSLEFFNKLNGLGVPTALTAIQGAAHAFDVAALDAVETMAQSIDLFLDRLLVNPKPYPAFGAGGGPRPGGPRPRG